MIGINAHKRSEQEFISILNRPAITRAMNKYLAEHEQGNLEFYPHYVFHEYHDLTILKTAFHYSNRTASQLNDADYHVKDIVTQYYLVDKWGGLREIAQKNLEAMNPDELFNKYNTLDEDLAPAIAWGNDRKTLIFNQN